MNIKIKNMVKIIVFLIKQERKTNKQKQHIDVQFVGVKNKMPFFIIGSSFGFAGDEEIEAIEAGSIGQAEEIRLEDMYQQIEAFKKTDEIFENEEDAENWINENT